MGEKLRKLIRLIRKKLKDAKFRADFLSKFLPAVAMILVGAGLMALNVMIYTSDDELVTFDEGYFIGSNSKIGELKKLEDDSTDVVEMVEAGIGSVIFKNDVNTYIEGSEEQSIDLSYPYFINGGLTLIMYEGNFNVINSSLERMTGYANMMMSYGKIYDTYDYNQIDNDNYILISYSDGVYINLYDMRIDTLNGAYTIPMHSFIYFAKDQISYYARTDSGYVAGIIPAISLDSSVVFYDENEGDAFAYDYEAFLTGIGTVFKKEEEVSKEIKVVTPVETVIKSTGNTTSDYEYTKTDKEFVWVKPEVSGGDFVGSVYVATGNLKIKDTAHVITKAPTFTFYVDGKIQMRRTFSRGGEIQVSGLTPNTHYTVIGEYVYLAEDLETKINVMFYGGSFDTGDASSLDPIDLSFNLSEYYSTKIKLNDLTAVGDLTNEALKGVVQISIVVNNVYYTLSSAQASYVVSGVPVDVSTADALKSSTEYDFEIKLIDRAGTEMKVTNNTGHWHTSKLEPTVSLKVAEQDVDVIKIRVKLSNKNNVPMENYRYVVTDSGGNNVANGLIEDSYVSLTSLTANALFTIQVYADIDTDDGQGMKQNYLLGSLDFTTISLGGLGFMNLTLENEEDSYNSVNFDASINTRKTNAVLTRLINEIKFFVLDENESIVKTMSIKGDDLTSMKNGETFDLSFLGLNVNTSYTIKATAYASQGEAKYENDCFLTVTTFTTTKRPAQVLISSLYTTGEMTDFDVTVSDPDGTIISDDVWVELRDEEDVLIKSTKIGKNQEEAERITFDHLTENKTYQIIFYVDEYNITNKNETIQSHFVLRSEEIITEEGISGTIGLISSRRVGNGDNLIDPYSTAKWIRARGDSYWNGSQPTVDDDGVIHLKALNTGWVYYNYDLSDYHGHVVKVSFKVKAAASPTDFYFRQYLFANGGTKLNVTTDGWTYYETTLMVGYTGSATTYFSASTTTSYEKYVYDYINFNFYGKSDKKTEYLIKEFQVYQYDLDNKVTIDTSDIELEYGYWSNRGVKYSSNSYIRYNKVIEIEQEGWYEMPFYPETNEYTMYMYIYTEGQASLNWTGAGWYSYNVTRYIPANSKIVIYFRRANGNWTPELTAEIDKSITGAIKSGIEIPYTEFTYDLITNVTVDIEDKREEITTNDYYIRATNSSGEYVFSEQYVELEETKKLTNVIKQLQLEEGSEFTVYLSVKIRDRFYDLDSFIIDTGSEIMGVSTLNDYFWMQPNADYVILNDLDFTGVTWYLGRSSYDTREGMIDYQGHTMTVEMQSNNNINRHFYYLGQNSVIKNMVLDIKITGDVTNNAWVGWAYQNKGLIENVYVNVYNEDGVIQNNTYRNGYNTLLVNRNYGTINNFIFELKNDFKITGNFGLITLYNYGTISNGYIFGEDVDMSSAAYNMTLPKIIATNSLFGSTIKNMYVLSNVKIPSNSNQSSGVLVGTLGGDMTGVYMIGDSNIQKLTVGPLVTTAQSAADYSRTYYVSDFIYTSGVGQKIPVLSLHNTNFQTNTLGSQFDIEDLVSQGYYPQLKFTSEDMPYQTYIELPEIEDSLIDILSSEVLESTYDTAKVKITINNPYGETISAITISDLTTELVEQSYANGVSEVIVNLKDPSSYKSKYAVRAITSTYEDIPSTKTFLEGERYIAVDLYKKIYNNTDWLTIQKNLSWNYVLMDNLDFTGFAKFSIGNFKGKLKGENHTISNILLDGMYGLFWNLYGQIYDLNFYNVQKHKVYGSQFGIIHYTYTGALLNNVHADLVTLDVPDTYSTTGDLYFGGLIAEIRNGCAVYNSSVKNVTITAATSKVSTIYAGGLFGRSYEQNVVYNSFAENVNIKVTNTTSAYVGGVVGYAYCGVFDSIYATGSVYSSSAGIGGFSGWLYSDNFVVTNSIIFVDICGEKNNVGGFVGTMYGSGTTSYNNIYTGHIFSNMSNSTIHKFAGYRSTWTYPTNNYVTDDVLINGSEYANDLETTIAKTSLYDSETYTDTLEFGEGFDYSRVSEHLMPKLYKYNSISELVPGQSDIKLDTEVLKIVYLRTITRANEVVVTVQFENSTGLNVTGVEVTDMTVDSIDNISNVFENDDGVMVTEMTFTASPEKYKDYYRLSKVIYEDENEEEKSAEKYYSIAATFYGEIWDLDDWQALDSNDPQNYLLMADLDFSQLPEGETPNIGVAFNRLTTESSETKHTIKNVNISTVQYTYRIGLIREITGELSNIIFDSINITSTSTYHTFGVINYNYGTIKNCEFKNSTFNTPGVYYVGFIANNNYGILIDNITIDHVTIKGRERVGALIGTWDDYYDGYIKNIYATNVTIDTTEYNGNTYYIGGLIGRSPYSDGNNSSLHPYANRYENINISDSTVTASSEKSQYVGGAVGYGGCEELTVDNVSVVGWKYVGGGFGVGRSYATDTIIENGSVTGDTYVGGFSGQGGGATFFTEGSVVYNMTVNGVTNVGGYHGYAYYPSDRNRVNVEYDEDSYNVAVYHTTVTGVTNVGAMYGTAYYTYDLGTYIDDVTVSGTDNVGGLAGRDTTYAFYSTVGVRMVNSSITATGQNAGGIVGYVESKNSSYFRNISFENVNVYANENAGAFYGKYCSELSSNSYNTYGLYFDGTISTGVNSTAGVFVGNDLSSGVAAATRWYGLYEGTTVNGVQLKNLNYGTSTEATTYTAANLQEGFLNTSNGSVYMNYSYPYAGYIDYIFLEAGSTYTFTFDQVDDNGAIILPFFYQNDEAKTYIYYASYGNVYKYIEGGFSSDYYKEQQFRVIKDCYMRVLVYYPTNLRSITITKTKNQNYGVSDTNILSADELRQRITWTTTLSNDSTLTNTLRTKLNMSSTYYDFSTIGNEGTAITVTDLSGNGANGTAYVSGANSSGMWFDGVNDYIEVGDNYSPIMSNYTIVAQVTIIRSVSLGDVFWYMQDDTNDGYYGLAMSGTTVYPLTYKSDYWSTGSYIPYNTSTMIAGSYNNTNGYIRTYVNGRYDYTRSIGKNKMNSVAADGTAYIGKPSSKYNGSTTHNYFYGMISKVMVYDRVLEDSELEAIYVAGAPVDTTGLRLYYDLTQYEDANGTAYYPELRSAYVPTAVTQAHIPLPTDTDAVSVPMLSASMTSTESLATTGVALEDSYKMYASGANTVNIEFDEDLPSDVEFSYSYGDYSSEVMDVEQRVYSFNYNYVDDLTIYLKSASEDYTTTIAASQLAKKISMQDENYYYINNDGELYVGDEQLISGAVNLMGTTALLANGHLYDVVNRTEQTGYSVTGGVRADAIPLYETSMGTKTVKTYYDFSVISSGENTATREKQIVINDDISYIYNQNGLNNNLVFNKYNGNIYQFGLDQDGSIISYKTAMESEQFFNNTNIAEMTFDINNNEPVMMIRYQNGAVKVLNYYEGTVVFAAGDEPRMSLMQFVGAVFTGGAILPQSTTAYEESEEIVSALATATDNEVINGVSVSGDDNSKEVSVSSEDEKGETIDGEFSDDKNAKVVNNFTTVYDSETGDYGVYSVDDMLDPTLDEAEITSVEEKAEANAFLYEYLYGERKNEEISSNKGIIYGVIIVLVVINLGVFARKFKKHEKED